MNERPSLLLTMIRWPSVLAGVIGGLIPFTAQHTALSATPPDNSLVLYLKLDGSAQDSSTLGNNGEVLGTPEFVTDTPLASGQAISLTSNDMGVSVPGSDSLSSNLFTLAYWVKPTTLQEGAGLERLTSRAGDNFETAIGNAAGVGGAPDLTLSYFGGGWVRTTASLKLNEWAHVAWRNRAPGGTNNFDLFVNGKLVYSGAGLPVGRPGNGLMNIGTRHNGTEGFEGLMDDVRLYGTPLSDSDIAALATPSDADGDGLPDWWERQNNLSASDSTGDNGANGDPDKDGLTNAQEYAAHTKAKEADTDGDGLKDGDEITRGTNPTLADTDGDGLTDGDEVTRGTNPLLADTDGDGVADGVEVALGSNPLDPLSGPKPDKYMVLHLKLDGDTQDSSTVGNNASLLSTPEFVKDTPLSSGQAIAFTSNEMGVSVPDSDSLSSNLFTLAYWVKPTALQGGAYDRLTSRTGFQFETAIGSGAAGPLTLAYYQGGWYSTSNGLAMNEWAHVAWRNRGTGPNDLDLFVNGRLVYTGRGVPATGPGSGLMNIGTSYTESEGFEGRMDDVRLYGAPLMNSDIAALAVPSDTDADGLPDWWEVQYGLSPTDANGDNGPTGDPDKDGLTNAQEYAAHTNPKAADTDGDGLTDSDELTRGTKPTVADTDNDGLSDGAEVKLGTNPLLSDTDGDTIPDGVEVDLGTNPLDPLSGPPASAFLVLQLKFDGDTVDSATPPNTASLLGTPEFVTDTPSGSGQALSFTANDMGVTVDANDSLAANPFTLCYWAKPTSGQEGNGLERLTSRSGDNFETAIGNAAGVGGGVPDLTLSYYAGAWIKTTAALKSNEWAHVAWRNRGPGAQDLDLFVNGRLVYTGAGVPAGRPGNGLMNIGTRHNQTEGFEGLMDDVRLYRAPLKSSDIAALVGFSITNIVRATNGSSVKLTFTSQPSRTYAVEYAADVGATNWTALTETLASGGSSTSYTNTATANLPSAFYRVRNVTP
jgi:hypothetical protein